MHSNTDSKTDSRGSRSHLINSHQVFALHCQNHVESEFRFHQMQAADLLCALLGVVCAVMEYDFEKAQRGEELVVVVVTGNAATLLLVWAITLRLHRELLWERAKSIASRHATFYTSRKHWKLLVEAVFSLPHPLWWLVDTTFETRQNTLSVTVNYNYNFMLAMCTLLRLYHLVRLATTFCVYRSNRAQRVCQLQGAQANSWFALRGLMASHPAFILPLLLFGVAFLAGWMLLILESPLSAYTSINYSYRDTLWMALISMTTVGYGDYYPVTIPGRIVAILACSWGVVILSLVVLALTTEFEQTPSQAASYSILERLQFHDSLVNTAAEFIASAGKCSQIAKHVPLDTVQLRSEQLTLRQKINAFQRMRAQRRVLYGVDTFPKVIEKELAELEKGLKSAVGQVGDIKELVREMEILCSAS